MTLSDTQFQEAIKNYLKSNSLNIASLARKASLSESTVGDWVRKGVKSEARRKQIVAEYPWLFDSGVKEERTPLRQLADKSLLVLIKTEQAHSSVLSLTATLVWFLFKASAEDRDYFRDWLGDDWKNFLELTRAMTGETAFEVTKQEGRLQWFQK